MKIVREDLVGLVKIVVEEVGVDLGNLGLGFVAIEKLDDSLFYLVVGFAHGSYYSKNRNTNESNVSLFYSSEHHIQQRILDDFFPLAKL